VSACFRLLPFAAPRPQLSETMCARHTWLPSVAALGNCLALALGHAGGQTICLLLSAIFGHCSRQLFGQSHAYGREGDRWCCLSQVVASELMKEGCCCTCNVLPALCLDMMVDSMLFAGIVGTVQKASLECMKDSGIAIYSRWRPFRSCTLGLHHPQHVGHGRYTHWLLGCGDIEHCCAQSRVDVG
jgi:hypothetical protein